MLDLSLSLSLSPSLSHTLFFFSLAVIVQRVQTELSQQVSSLQSDGRVSWVAPTHVCMESVLYKLQALVYINRIASVLRYKTLGCCLGIGEGGFDCRKHAVRNAKKAEINFKWFSWWHIVLAVIGFSECDLEESSEKISSPGTMLHLKGKTFSSEITVKCCWRIITSASWSLVDDVRFSTCLADNHQDWIIFSKKASLVVPHWHIQINFALCVFVCVCVYAGGWQGELR